MGSTKGWRSPDFLTDPGMAEVVQRRTARGSVSSCEADVTAVEGGADDIIAAAMIAYSSEDPAHPIEHAFHKYSGPGATRGISARDNTVEHIVIEFNRPQKSDDYPMRSKTCSRAHPGSPM